jgi:hypothetical protein
MRFGLLARLDAQAAQHEPDGRLIRRARLI